MMVSEKHEVQEQKELAIIYRHAGGSKEACVCCNRRGGELTQPQICCNVNNQE